jgi:hypothetical protein
MKKALYYKEYYSPVAYGYKPDHKVKSYFKFIMVFDLKEGLRFTACVPNFSYCCRNPIRTVLRVLEHESIGMAKYNKIKEDTRACGLYKKLDCKPIKL